MNVDDDERERSESGECWWHENTETGEPRGKPKNTDSVQHRHHYVEPATAVMVSQCSNQLSCYCNWNYFPKSNKRGKSLYLLYIWLQFWYRHKREMVEKFCSLLGMFSFWKIFFHTGYIHIFHSGFLTKIFKITINSKSTYIIRP